MIETIINILKDLINDEEILSGITSESDLINDIGLDSIQMINFILRIEDEFDIEIDFDDIEIEIMYNLGDFAEYVKKCKQE